MSWNYRVVRYSHPDSPEPLYAVTEVYYDEGGEIVAVSEFNNKLIHWESFDGLAFTAEKIVEAVSKPVVELDILWRKWDIKAPPWEKE